MSSRGKREGTDSLERVSGVGCGDSANPASHLLKMTAAGNKLPRSGRRQVLVLTAASAVAVTFLAFSGGDWLSLESLQARRYELLQYTQTNFWTLFVLWGLIYTVAAAISLPGAAVLSLVSGFLFGTIGGTVLIVVSATAGATLLLLAARYLFATAVRERLERNATAARLIAGFERGAFNYLLFLRLVPIFPFWLVNLALSVTRINVRTYVVATAVGMLPGSFAYANLGRSLGEIESATGLLSADVMVALGLLGVLALSPLALRRRAGGEGG